MKTQDGGVVLSSAFPTYMTECALMTIAFYNVIELHFLLFSTFKRWRGLYFWSVFAAMWGVAINGLGVVMKTFKLNDASPAHVMLVVVALILGWYLMVTGQALVLYSRLHMVVYNPSVIRGVLFMIIFTVLVCHIPITIIVFLMFARPGVSSYADVYKIYEPLQLTIFSLQEITISGIYIYFALMTLRPIQSIRGQKARLTFWRLIYVNIFVIALDIILVSIQYAGYDEVQHFYKVAVYSVKLKMEFVVLNQLLEVTRNRTEDWSNYQHNSQPIVDVDSTGTTKNRNARDLGDPHTTLTGTDHIPLSKIRSGGVFKTTEEVTEYSGPPGSVEGEK
ncbi:hypothetical protein FGG08_007158 [Glutinoglossum americanum]|uniref:DUF7703 domain-containing protein n=1 Tax=Glutinoglossum americanum TaxID=1670608 RepID=A0A9P8I3X8_9PEZI|nr:hypothetical protein FGG08_007158 [Glutinoglossum americanum]